MKAVNLLGRLICQDQGISALEYALMLSLIGAGLMAAVVGLGSPRRGAISTTPRPC